MAFELDNTKLNDKFYTSGIPTSTTTSGTGQLRVADQTADQTALNLGVAGLKYLRGRIFAKSGIANTETFAFNVRVDTVVGMTSPELIYQSPTYTAVTGDVAVCMDFEGCSEDGFQFVSIVVTNAGTWTFDLVLEGF
jgi:hypothetical protein